MINNDGIQHLCASSYAVFPKTSEESDLKFSPESLMPERVISFLVSPDETFSEASCIWVRRSPSLKLLSFLYEKKIEGSKNDGNKVKVILLLI